MSIKEIHTFLNSGTKHYQLQEEVSCGIALTKDFSNYLTPLLEQVGEDEREENEEFPEVHTLTLEYLQDRCEKEQPKHDLVHTVTVADGDLFTFWFLFGLTPFFSCYDMTVKNAVTYKVSNKDPYLKQTITYLAGFCSALNDFIDHLELEDWFIADLYNK